MKTLGRLQNEDHTALIVPALNDTNTTVRSAVYFALGQIGDERAAVPLAARLRREASLRLLNEGVKALGKMGGTAASAGSASYLKHEHPLIRAEACYALGRMEDSTQTAQLVALLGDESDDVRAAAAYAIEKSGQEEFASGLAPLFRDESPVVREFAIRAAGKLGDASTVLAGSHLLRDESWRVRVNSARAMGEVGGPDAAAALVEALTIPTDHMITRVTIVQALGATGEQAARPALERILLGEAGPLTLPALRAIARLPGEGSIEQLRVFHDAENAAIREAAWEEGARIAEREEYAAHLAQFWNTDDARVKKGIVAGLAARERPPLDFLVSALDVKDAPTLVLAADAIGEHGGPGEREALQRLYWSHPGATTEDGEVRLVALSALIALGGDPPGDRDPGAIERDSLFQAALLDTDERVRREASSFFTDHGVKFVPPAAADTLLSPGFLAGIESGTATIETERGTIRVELLAEEAPVTVRNFMKLASEGYYDGLVFHRVVPNFVIQAGCPRGDGWGDPGYSIRCEYNPVRYDRYVMGMALSGKDTGGSQWFITQTPQPHLDGRYTVFGRVIDGFDVVDQTLQGDPIMAIRVEP
ncbi:MAG: hypothetical protein HKN20_03130 [Gemmatimonadetes bacterium]|nr:hypothetical protein [Gemmatimonadota bacterium]